MALEVDVKSFWRDGFTLVRGAYTPAEIHQMRRDALDHKGEHGGDLLSNPFLNRVQLDGKMTEIARQILDTDDLVYYGDTAVAIRPGGPGWHKDNADRLDPNAPDWQSPYTQLRFGIYLQDHHDHSGGLNIKVGSHDVCDFETGKIRQLRSRVGDIGVWSMRITHSAAATMLKWAPLRDRYPDPFQVKTINPKHILPRPKRRRIAIFSAIGRDDEHAERYVEYLKTRTYAVWQWRHTTYSDDQLKIMADQGVRVRNVRQEIEGDSSVGQNEKWAPIAY